MEDQKNEPKNTKDIDFETGSAEPQKQVTQPHAPAPAPAQTSAAPAQPPTTSAQAPAAAKAPTASTQAQPPAKPASTLSSASTPAPVNKQKVLLGCLGAFGSIMIIFLVLSFIFLAQSSEEVSPIAKLLGVNQAVFINGLITFIHIIFILVSLTAFIFTMVGLFKASMAKKGDLIEKKAGLRMTLVSGSILFLILIIWGFVYVFLDAKRVQITPQLIEPIVTEPEETLNLTAPVEIKFDASNVPFDKNKYQIVSHDWDFGDKDTGTSQIVSHIYKEKGIYDVKLTITVKNKNTGELSVGGEYHVTVSITNQALTAIFTADPQSGEAPLKVKFDASESSDPDGDIKEYAWDFDKDGEFDDAEGKTPEYEFKKMGKYIVTLRVVSATGEFDVEEKEIDVKKEESPQAVIEIVDEPVSFTIGVSYVFKAEKSTSPNGKIEKYEWNFNDGSKPENTKTVSHVFNAEGTYEVTLKIIDEKLEEGQISKKIIVGGPKGTPKAKIKTDPMVEGETGYLTGKVPFTVVFDARETTDSDDNIVDYNWDFDGDGKNDSFGSVASHTFKEEGTFTTALTVIDADENKGIATQVVKVEAQGIIISLKADKVEGNIPLTVNFDASGSSYTDGQIVSYEWNFGDGTPKKVGSATISHKYTTIGTFTTSVAITASDKKQSTKEITVTVREIPLSACFVSVFEEGEAPLETSFDPGCSTGTILNYLWDFGDGSTSTSVKPTHVFKDPGDYKTILEISDAENIISKSELTIKVK
ncbi:MAG: PKD domain-containing protein [Patescibacteria group bacterium]